MRLSSVAVATILALFFAAPLRAGVLYMGAGSSVFEINAQVGGQVITSASIGVGPNPEGMAIGPDNRLYVVAAGGTARVDSFALDLSGHVTGFVSDFSGGLFVPQGLAFGPVDKNLYVGATGAAYRYFGPNSATPGGNDPSGNNGQAWSSPVGSLIGVANTPDGWIYGSTGDGNGTIYAFNPLNGAATIEATNLGSNMEGIAIDPSGTALFARYKGADEVFKFLINPDHSLTNVPLFISDYQPATGLGQYQGLAVGPDGAVYATTRTSNGVDADFVVRIDPNTGHATTFIHGNINSFTGGGNPTFLIFAPPVPEPSTLALLIVGCGVGLIAWRRPRLRRASSR